MKWISVKERLPEMKYYHETGTGNDFKYSDLVLGYYEDPEEYIVLEFEKGNEWQQWFSPAYDDAVNPPDKWCEIHPPR